MSISALAAVRSNAALFATASEQGHGKLGSVAIDDCGTPVPHKWPGGNPPPPPPVFNLAHFAGVSLQTPVRADDDWCGTVPHRLPVPPPPPPWVDGISQFLNNR